jgi:putative phage-type endonuclease
VKIHYVEQRTEEWYKLRAGVPTASSFDKIVTTKGEPSKQAEKYLYRLAGERIIGKPAEAFQSEAMARGIEMENEARLGYSITTGLNVDGVGFCVADEGYGCSPDGFIGDDGLLEIKCPNIDTHVGYLIDDCLPTTYFQQVQGQLLVTGRKWCDFVSYYPGLKMLIVRVEPDKSFQEKLHGELVMFCHKLDTIVKQIQ